MANYAQIDARSAFLSTDFGEEIARKWFGNETVDALPRYIRGPRKGKIKGAVTWSKVVRGGWVRVGVETANGGPSGYVENRVGHIFERKLHEIVSDRFGTHVGKVVRDLDREEIEQKYRRLELARIDEEMRDIEMKRCRLEQVILEGKFVEYNDTYQGIIKELNEDMNALTDYLASYSKKK